MFGFFSSHGPKYVTPAPSLKGKTAIVTGSNAGIGYGIALYLASLDSRVILACRNAQKAEAAKESILKDHPHAQVEVMQLDLASLASAHRFAEEWAKQDRAHTPVDLLFCNGGGTFISLAKTDDGFENSYQINYLTHFLLLRLLLPFLRIAETPRTVFTSSNAASWGRVALDNLNCESIPESSWSGLARLKTGMQVYGNSKAMQMLCVVYLQRLLQASSIAEDHKIAIHAVYPGAVASDMAKADHLGVSKLIALPAHYGMKAFARSIHTGAMPSLWAGLSNEAGQRENYGSYWDENCAKHDWINDGCKDDDLMQTFYERSCKDAGISTQL